MGAFFVCNNTIMAGFERVKGGDRGYSKGTISSITVVAGDLLAKDRSNEVLILATSSSSIEDLAGVAVEARTTADTEVLYQEIQEGDEYVVPVTNNSSSSHRYHRMVLTDENEVNNTGTDSTSDAAVFEQLYPVGAAADKKIRGKFVRIVDRA